ncbi:pectate lyase [Uliginosibacterium paludis]|uniref:Pectate lyase n=1 Tax=Uliginosibacterium paludis TaxID=1615952 RepID=A0ABV2CPT6_9RHOO
MTTPERHLISLLLCAALAACGGGGSSNDSSTPTATSSSSSQAASSAPAAGSSSSASSKPASSASSSSVATSSASSAPVLSQSGNPASGELNTYTVLLSSAGDAAARLAADKAKADIILTWQTREGGFYKHITDSKAGAGTLYSVAWSSGSKSSTWLGENGVDLGTIDNDATTSELFFLADVYKRSGDTKYRDAARRTLDFLLLMQYPSGGFPQVYPARAGTSYSNYVTFNDDAMARVMLVLDQVAKKSAPVDTQDLFTAEQYSKLSAAIAKGIDFILKSQIVQSGVKTVWCAQHDPVTYEAKEARSYEWPSKSGKESVGIVGFLMSQPQTPEVKAAVQAALAWFRSSAVQVADTAYVNRPSGNTDDTWNPIQAKTGSVMWYRFYDLDKDTGFFSGRTAAEGGKGKQYNIMDIEAERRYGYSWGGAYAATLLSYASSVGY